MQSESFKEKPEVFAPDLFFYSKYEEIYKVTVFEPPALQTPVPEPFIHNLWKHQKFDGEALHTTEGHRIKVIRIGTHNSDAGPDFLNAALEIAGTTWYGDVEIHRTSHEWYAHKHHENARYNSTILHVTLFQDQATGSLMRSDNTPIPELVLSPILHTPLRSLLYAHRTIAENKLACTDLLPQLPLTDLTSWLHELGKQRLLRKKGQVEEAFLSKPDLEDILHHLIFIGLGYAKNSAAMFSLVQRIPLEMARSFEDPLDLEALHLGAAGLIPARKKQANAKSNVVGYIREIQERFERINRELNLPVMSPHSWHFFRLRPSNFPTLRVAQAAVLFSHEGLLYRDGIGSLAAAFSSSQEKQILSEFGRLLNVSPSVFWSTHYQFDTTVSNKSSQIGRERRTKLLLNAIFPVMLVYAEQKHDPALERTIFRLLKYIKSERDVITQLYRHLQLEEINASVSQGLHELHAGFCMKGECLNCNIGKSLINNSL